MKGVLFGQVNHKPVCLYRLNGSAGFFAEILTYGAAVKSIMVPGPDGNLTDVVLGFDSLDGYLSDRSSYIGVVCGRFANRIHHAEFELDGIRYQVSRNHGKHCLHGGFAGFNRVVWDATPIEGHQAVRLSMISPDGDEGFPGEVKVSLIYEVTAKNELLLTYEAVTTKPTVINLTNHSYFNLNGGGSDIKSHQLWIASSYITETDDDLIPTGKLIPVQGTRYDFMKNRSVKLPEENPFKGYDNNFALDTPGLAKPAAILMNPERGIAMETRTTQPAIQIYTANHFDGSQKGKGNITYDRHYGICLETQGFPDAPNHPGFPSARLDPGQIYRHTTIYRFYSIQ